MWDHAFLHSPFLTPEQAGRLAIWVQHSSQLLSLLLTLGPLAQIHLAHIPSFKIINFFSLLRIQNAGGDMTPAEMVVYDQATSVQSLPSLTRHRWQHTL